MIRELESDHINKAFDEIDSSGIPKENIYNYYYVEHTDGREYPFKLIVREAYKIASNSSTYLEFSSTQSNRSYIRELGFKINYHPENLNFFKTKDLHSFSKVAGQKYRQENPINTRDSSLIIPCVYKVNYWAKNSLIEDFEQKSDRSWQWSGSFKSYLWIRIYRKGGSKKIYFVFGVDKDGDLYLELNCQRSNHTGGKTKPLPNQLIKIFDNYLESSDYEKKVIKLEDIKNYSWNDLISISQEFLYRNAPLYDELEALINGDVQSLSENVPRIIEDDLPPSNIKSYISEERSFSGKKTDWGKKQLASSKLGRSGEQLVLEIENEKLKSLKLTGVVDDDLYAVKKLDGEGYDILSYDSNGNELYIEVKTTKRSRNEPFFLSANEKAFLELNKESYVIYRLYEYNSIKSSSKLFKISGRDFQNYTLKPTNYEVSL